MDLPASAENTFDTFLKMIRLNICSKIVVCKIMTFPHVKTDENVVLKEWYKDLSS